MPIDAQLPTASNRPQRWATAALAALLLSTPQIWPAVAQADDTPPQQPTAEIAPHASAQAGEQAGARQATAGQVAGQPWVAEPVAVELPTAPQPYAAWIAAGAVTFDFYDPRRETFAFAAETRFELHFSYRCQMRWQRVGGPAADGAESAESEVGAADSRDAAGRSMRSKRARSRKPRAGKPSNDKANNGKAAQAVAQSGAHQPAELEVRLVYDVVELTVKHRIRLPITLAGPSFFDHPLVRHEFDHVAISADPRLRSRLAGMLAERNALILEPLVDEPAAGTDSRDERQLRLRYGAVARSAASRESDRTFVDFVEGVAIRYRELDRLSSHGARQLAAEQRNRLIPRAGNRAP